jgi:CIC family chloride channel protein
LTSRLPEPVLLLVLAVLVGAVGGVGAVVFRLMIRAAQVGFHAVIPTGGGSPLPHAATAVLPVLGLMLVGVISTYFAREVKGHGVPQILEALALRGGRIRPRVGFFGILAPAITIGSGGSVGREGPIALIGAAFGSSLGQMLKLADRYTMLLVGCGAAAGIGATFNAPIAGGLFGMEVVLGSYAMGTLVPCFVASVVGVTVFNAILGNQLVLPVPPLAFRSPLSVVVMAVLGLLAGLFGIVYTRGLTYFEDLFDGWNWPFWRRAIVGGLVVGLLGLLLPEVLGVGYGPMRAVASGQLAGLLLLGLLVGKLLATLVTIGAGGSGGVFAPSLYLGLMFGTVYGSLVHGLLPNVLADARVFGVAGMGAVFAAAAQAPLTAGVIVLEMTGDYHLTLGVLMAAALSYFVYGSLQRDTMYTVRLSRRGIRILRGAEVRPLQVMPAKSAMRPLSQPLSGSDTVSEAQSKLGELHADALVVQSDEGLYLGVVDLPTLLAASARDPQGRVADVQFTRVPALAPDSNLDDAMQRFGVYNTPLVPVVENGRAVGVLAPNDVMRAYHTRTALSLETSRKVALIQAETGSPGAFQLVALSQHNPWVGRRVRELALPSSAVVVSIQRGDRTIIPRGDTELMSDDRLMLYVNPGSAVDEVRRYVAGP